MERIETVIAYLQLDLLEYIAWRDSGPHGRVLEA